MIKMNQLLDEDFLNELTYEPLTPANWDAFAGLFGPKGACGGCWCMYYRMNKQDFTEGKLNDGNKNAIHELVMQNKPVGILGIYQGQAIAWCAFAPRQDFQKLARSRVHRPIDNEQVWSIPCFFIARNFRRLGISVQLLKGVIEYARTKGIKIIEAYPTIPGQQKLPDSFAWIGLYKSFERAEFLIVDQASKNRPMVRYYISEEQGLLP
jgi:GNAT superfamily N-acetyltransferase